jgi:hypothetical protein
VARRGSPAVDPQGRTAWEEMLDTWRVPVAEDAPAATTGETAPSDWDGWLSALFPKYVSAPHAARHRELWSWVWSVKPDERAAPLVAIWPRGGGKSTSCELASVALGLRGVRRYIWYIRATQEQADNSVSNIASLLEADTVERYYPEHAERQLSKYGQSKGWKRNRLRTAGGLVIDAIGLDTAARGAKVDEQRPDLIILDDIDAKHDSAEATKKKLATITTSLLPAGSTDATVLAVQNLIIPHGIFARLADGRADFLADRSVLGPYPAVVGLKTEPVTNPKTGRITHRIVRGEASWEGQNLRVAQHQIDTWGLSAFLQEAQHAVHEREGALWTKDLIQRVDTLPPLKRVVIAVDPSGGGDEIGIIGAGLGYDGRGYPFADRSQKGSLGPLNWGSATVDLFDEYEADLIAAERNFGGDMVEGNIRSSAPGRRIPVKMVSASRGKALRAEPVATLYENGLVSHVGVFPELESEMTGWVPGDPQSPNRLDALVWCLTELMLQPKATPNAPIPGSRVIRRYR